MGRLPCQFHPRNDPIAFCCQTEVAGDRQGSSGMVARYHPDGDSSRVAGGDRFSHARPQGVDLQSSSITPPTPPRQVPAIKALPPVSFAEHEAGIENVLIFLATAIKLLSTCNKNIKIIYTTLQSRESHDDNLNLPIASGIDSSGSSHRGDRPRARVGICAHSGSGF